MKEIKTISCHGTSYTQGGGFEWHHDGKDEFLERFYKDIDCPKTQFDYSWPGQLKKISGLKIQNYGKSGFGNQKVYRDIYDIFVNSELDFTSHLFLIEMSYIGRSELYINELSDYVIMNYGIHGKYPNEKAKIHGAALDYYDQTESQTKIIEKKYDFLKEYIESTHNIRKISKDICRGMDFLVSFLEYNNLNYEFTSSSISWFNTKIESSKFIKYPSLDKKRFDTDMVGYVMNHGMTIEDETNGGIQDSHFGFEGNKNVANIIYEQLKEKYKL